MPRAPRIVWSPEYDSKTGLITKRRAVTVPEGKTGLRAVRKDWKASAGCGPGGSHGSHPSYFSHHGFCYDCAICCGEGETLCFKEGTPCFCPNDPQAGHYYALCEHVTSTFVTPVPGVGGFSCIEFTPGSQSIFVSNISELPGPVHLVGPGPFQTCRECCETAEPGCPKDCSDCCFGGLTVHIPAHELIFQEPACSERWPAITATLQQTANCEWEGWGGPYTIDYFGNKLCDIIEDATLVYACMNLFCSGQTWILTVAFLQSNTAQPCNPCIDSPCTFFEYGGCSFSAPAITNQCPPSNIPWQPVSGHGCPGAIIQCPEFFNATSVETASVGFGDTLAKGIKKLTRGRIKPCGGCQKRQATLNKLLPYNVRK